MEEGGGTGKVEKTRSSREEAAALAAAGTAAVTRAAVCTTFQQLGVCLACARQVADEAAAGRACLLQLLGCKTGHQLAGIDITKLPPSILTRYVSKPMFLTSFHSLFVLNISVSQMYRAFNEHPKQLDENRELTGPSENFFHLHLHFRCFPAQTMSPCCSN